MLKFILRATMILVLGALLALPLLPESAESADPAQAKVDGQPVPCQVLDGQSWWEPQRSVFDPLHPGKDKQGHIHVETCFPAFQRISGSTLDLELVVHLHNMPGILRQVRLYAYGDEGMSHRIGGSDGNRLDLRCPVADCTHRFNMRLDLTKALYSGLHSIIPEVQVQNEPLSNGKPGGRQMTLPYWAIDLDNGKPLPPVGSVLYAQQNTRIPVRGLMGDSQYNYLKESYASVGIRRTDLPWSDATLAFTPKAGVWTFEGFFEKDTGFVWVDPNLHGTPPSKGTVIYDGVGGPALGSARKKLIAVDTRQFTNGVHRLLIGTCNVNVPETAAGVGGGDPNATTWDRGDHCGTLVIRFLVAN